MNELTKKIGSFFLDIIQTIVMALSLFVVCYLFLFQPHVVKGNSMQPNFSDSDFLLTDKISYRFNEPQRLDVVVFKAPKSEPCSDQECEYIKRIIGLPGDKVMILNGGVFINSQPFVESYLPNGLFTQEGAYLRQGETAELKDGEYLMFGDNRPYSRDGREFGPIKRSSIIGKAWLRYWPLNHFGVIKHL